MQHANLSTRLGALLPWLRDADLWLIVRQYTLIVPERYLFVEGCPKLKEFDPDLVDFYDPEKQGGNGRAVRPYYPIEINGKMQKVPVILQTPKQKSKWGYSHSVEYNSHSIEVNLNEDTALFHQTMKRLDERVKKVCLDNKHLWFTNSKTMDEKVMNFIYAPMVKVNERNGTRYDDSMRFKIKEYKKKGKSFFNAQAFDSSSTQETPKPIELTEIGQGDCIKCLFHFGKIWIAQKIYTPLDLIQVKKMEMSTMPVIRGYALCDDGEDQ